MFSLSWLGVEYLSKYSLINVRLQLENNPNAYVKNKKDLNDFAITIIKYFFDYCEWIIVIKTRSILATASGTKVTEIALEESLKIFFWYCLEEYKQGLTAVINYDNSLIRTANFWLDIAIYWR